MKLFNYALISGQDTRYTSGTTGVSQFHE